MRCYKFLILFVPAIFLLEPLRYQNYTFGDKSKGYVVEYRIKRNKLVNNTIPERFEIYSIGNHPVEMIAFLEGKSHPLSKWAKKNQWRLDENFDYKEIELIAFFKGDSANWKNTKIKAVGEFLSSDQRTMGLFLREIFLIKGVVQCGNGTGKITDPFSVSIAASAPNVKQIKSQIQKLAARFNLKISSIELRDGY